MKRTLIAVAVLSLAAVARAGDDGAALFSKKCTVCHGKDGKGSSGGLKMGAPDLNATKLSQPEIEAVIANGRGKMMASKGKLTEGEIASLARFVKAGLK